ncbi:MAG: SemiSWEET transporter [Leptospiraceae bacterium]|nr:SemiSWEET transporter [Leptospiraceae bacterium]
MNLDTIIGYLAGLLTTIAFIPQMLRVILTKQTNDISRNMYLVFILGILLWLAYGIMRSETPIIIPNIFTLIFATIILIYKLKEK